MRVRVHVQRIDMVCSPRLQLDSTFVSVLPKKSFSVLYILYNTLHTVAHIYTLHLHATVEQGVCPDCILEHADRWLSAVQLLRRVYHPLHLHHTVSNFIFISLAVFRVLFVCVHDGGSINVCSTIRQTTPPPQC